MDYVKALHEIMKKPTPTKVKGPLLVINDRGIFFNGKNYGNDSQAAQKARDAYYSKGEASQGT